jgi:formate dehydrogenase maturation protein FdhE
MKTVTTFDWQKLLNKAMKDCLDSIFDCEWDEDANAYYEEFLSQVEKYRKKDVQKWAKFLYNDELKQEGDSDELFCGGTVMEFLDDVCKAAIKHVDWAIATQHCEKLLNRKR